MSRGPGRIERAIVAILAAEPDNAFTVDELCLRIYRPDLSGNYRRRLPASMYRPQLQHRVAAIRAGKAIAGRGNVAWLRSFQRGGALVFYTADNVMSYGMAHLKGWRTNQTEDQLHARLTDDQDQGTHIRPGGIWWLHVQLFIAQRDGEAERAAELQRAIDQHTAAHIAGLRNFALAYD